MDKIVKTKNYQSQSLAREGCIVVGKAWHLAGKAFSLSDQAKLYCGWTSLASDQEYLVCVWPGKTVLWLGKSSIWMGKCDCKTGPLVASSEIQFVCSQELIHFTLTSAFTAPFSLL
jgi:hypothetical protein